ncbi:unnamed protein product [Moneuplotes crassus]|uniref:Uncharacterized protein n=1 Tax=Euplotes crassus TaxID=5936 RepID=A0AAD1XKV4_EUPCR|nr:unnamed protein product [Moneuplotes crassus]
MWFLSIIGVFRVVFACKYYLYADLNLSILGTLFEFCSVFTLILTYFIFNVKTKIYHYIRVGLLITCAAIISLCRQKTQDVFVIVEGKVIERYSKIVQISIRILWFAYFTLRTLYLKHFKKCFQPFCFYFSQLHLRTHLLDSYNYFHNDCRSILKILAEFFDRSTPNLESLENIMKLPMGLHGKQQLSLLEAPLQTILDVFLLDQTPATLEILVCILGIIGALVIALGNSIYNFLRITEDE